MAIKIKPPEHQNHERWLVSYADFITLLFAFFVVMFASSQTDKGRAKEVSEAVSKALADGKSFGMPPSVAKILGGTIDDKGKGNNQMKGPGGAQHVDKDTPPDNIIELMPSLQRLNKDLEDEVKAGKLEIKMEARGLVVSLRQSAFFPSGEDVIDPVTYPTVKKVATLLASLPNAIQLEGHTDAVPIHNGKFKSNWELSCARGIALLEVLCGQFGLPRNRFSVVGRAETVPLESNDTAEGRARNRRVDVVILNGLHLQSSQKPSPINTAAHPAK